MKNRTKRDNAADFIRDAVNQGWNVQKTWTKYFFAFSAGGRVSQTDFLDIWAEITRHNPVD